MLTVEEKIYTIPVTEAFAKKDGCPLCRLKKDLDEAERGLIMGASMMEPDIRIKTNELGFCARHYEKLFAMKNRLSLGLMLESHLKEQADKIAIRKKALIGGDRSAKAAENMKALSSSCYICRRVEEKFEKMLSTVYYLWQKEPSFRTSFAEQPYYCVPHAQKLLEHAGKLDKKERAAFTEALHTVQDAYMNALTEDISWFCKKFDYRYENEPWGNAKDAIERTIKFLSGEE